MRLSSPRLALGDQMRGVWVQGRLVRRVKHPRSWPPSLPGCRPFRKRHTRKRSGGCEPLFTQLPQRGIRPPVRARCAALHPRLLPRGFRHFSPALDPPLRSRALEKEARRMPRQPHPRMLEKAMQECVLSGRLEPAVSSWAVAAHSCPNWQPFVRGLARRRRPARPDPSLSNTRARRPPTRKCPFSRALGAPTPPMPLSRPILRCPSRR